MNPEKIASLIRRAVRERVLPPGRVINQDELARRFGVSRIPLREALRTLAGEGLIVMRPGMGAVVFELDVHEIEELYDLRLRLEPPLARLVAEQVRPREVEELRWLVQRVEDSSGANPEERLGLHHAFRRRMYEIPERHHTVRLVTQLLNLVEPYARYHADVLGAGDRIVADLLQEVDALRARDGTRLAKLITANVKDVRKVLVSAMRTRRPDDQAWNAPFVSSSTDA
ncbi:MAG: GntR family transcriptional regulator [Streptosporangiales bacterium]|nr:GntR family transcriptional regulator [Streptosporangiales bacterium]MBO0890568.1 GntR family transcriptional regulator [Acidothermales bacterium]